MATGAEAAFLPALDGFAGAGAEPAGAALLRRAVLGGSVPSARLAGSAFRGCAGGVVGGSDAGATTLRSAGRRAGVVRGEAMGGVRDAADG
ncbi:MAG: hypothetical protein ACKOFK_09685 [Betaproteobacteria bacterium]